MEQKTEKKQKKETAMVLSKISLMPETRKILLQQTPKEFIRQREGRGGKKFDYVEIGYVVSQLNTIYGELNWDFEVVDKQKEGDEIWVQGKLTIKDHINGFQISKTQFGQCQLKQKQSIGDGFKSATSDCLKKCASLFGIAQDVYWQLLDENPTNQNNEGKITTNEEFQRIKNTVGKAIDPNILRELLKKIPPSKIYTLAQKKELTAIINQKLNELQGETQEKPRTIEV